MTNKNVAVIIRIVAGNFTQGFNVQFELLNDGRLVGGRRDCRIPSAPELPQIYQNWSESYRRLAIGGRKIPDHMSMAEIKPVEAQVTHESPGDECAKATAKLKEKMAAWFKHQEFQFLAAQIRNEATIDGQSILATDESIPIIFDIHTRDREVDNLLKKVPWHEWAFLRRHLLNAEPVLSSGKFQQVEPLMLPVNVLVVLGSSEGGLELDIDRAEWSKLEAQGANITVIERPSLRELDLALRGEVDDQTGLSWDVVFFAGHSTTKKETLEDGYLQINDQETIELEVLDEPLAIARRQGLKLAIFNSCDGLGLANFLANLAVPFSIVMREPVPDVIARDFLEYFLLQFSTGKPLYKAMREARSRLRPRTGDPSGTYPLATWLPVLCQNPTQRELFWPIETEEPSTILDNSNQQDSSLPKPNGCLNSLGIKLIALACLSGALILAIIGISMFSNKLNSTHNSLSTVTNDSSIEPTVKDDSFSIGEEVLLQTDSADTSLVAGSNAFAEGNYKDAITYFREILNQDQNNPEVMIYLNNAIARNSGKPIKTVAMSIATLGKEEDEAKEVLRGVAQLQAENNCGIMNLVAGIQDPSAELRCEDSEIALQVLLSDHEDMNANNKALDHFNSIKADKQVLGLIGHYDSNITFDIDKVIRDEGLNMPVVSVISTAGRQGENPSGKVFRTSPTDDITIRNWENLLDDEEVDSIIILHDSDRSKYSKYLADGIDEALPNRIERARCNLKDIDVCFENLPSSSVDAILLIPSGREESINSALEYVERYSAEFDSNPILLGGDPLYGNEVLEKIIRGSLLENLIVSVPWHRGKTQTDYEIEASQLWGNSGINWRSAMGYDATWLLKNAVQASSECNDVTDILDCRAAVSSYIRQNGLEEGATGRLQFDDVGDRIVDEENSQVGVLVRVDLEKNTYEYLEEASPQ